METNDIKTKEQALELMSTIAKSFNILNKEYMQRDVVSLDSNKIKISSLFSPPREVFSNNSTSFPNLKNKYPQSILNSVFPTDNLWQSDTTWTGDFTYNGAFAITQYSKNSMSDNIIPRRIITYAGLYGSTKSWFIVTRSLYSTQEWSELRQRVNVSKNSISGSIYIDANSIKNLYSDNINVTGSYTNQAGPITITLNNGFFPVMSIPQ